MKEKLASAQNESKGNLLFEVYKRSSDLCLQLYEKELLTESSFLHIYGLYDENFTVEQLCVIAGLYEWRDRMARMEDESTGYVLPNRMLLKIAKRMPDTISALHALVKRKHPYVERDLSTVFDVIKTSKQTKLKVVENLIEEASKLDANRKGEEKRKEFYNSQALPTLSVEKGISDSRMPLSTDTSAQKNTSSIEVDETEPITFSTEKINDQNSMEKAAFFFRNDQEAVKVGLTCTSSLFKRKSNHPTDEHRKPSSDNSNNMAGKTAQKDLLTSSLRQGIFSQSKGLESMAMETEDAHVLTTNSKCSNDFIPDMTESPVLHHGCPDKTVDEIKGGTQVKITSVQGKKLSRGLASMLGSSVSKSRTDADSKACDNEQDSVKTKLEQIKASITLPFGKNGSHRVESLHQMLKSGEASDPGDLNVQMDNFSESKSGNTALVSHEEAQVEVHLPMDTKIQCSSSDTQNDTRLVSMSRGIITKDGKKFRTWWPPFENNVLSMVTDTSEVGGSELPLSLSELRLKMQRRSKGNNCFKFIDNGSLIVDSNRDGLHNGRKRKGHSQRGHDVTNSVEKKDELAPFDYTAARQSMGFTLRNEFMNNSKGSNKSVNKHSKKGKEPGFDPMSRISADDVIQPGKRRQVFPSSGNRSATFR